MWNFEIYVNVWYLFGFFLVLFNVIMVQLSYSVLINGDVILSCFVLVNLLVFILWIFIFNSGGVIVIFVFIFKYFFVIFIIVFFFDCEVS